MDTSRYLICSDIHGRQENFKMALEHAASVDCVGIIIAGDVELKRDDIEFMIYDAFKGKKPPKLYLVKGNCDYQNTSNLNDMITFMIPGNLRVMLTHGHRYHVKSDLGVMIMVADNLKADIVIYGHTHQFDNHREGRIQVINPGALCGGYFDPPSYVIMTIGSDIFDFERKFIK